MRNIVIKPIQLFVHKSVTFTNTEEHFLNSEAETSELLENLEKNVSSVQHAL